MALHVSLRLHDLRYTLDERAVVLKPIRKELLLRHPRFAVDAIDKLDHEGRDVPALPIQPGFTSNRCLDIMQGIIFLLNLLTLNPRSATRRARSRPSLRPALRRRRPGPAQFETHRTRCAIVIRIGWDREGNRAPRPDG